MRAKALLFPFISCPALSALSASFVPQFPLCSSVRVMGYGGGLPGVLVLDGSGDGSSGFGRCCAMLSPSQHTVGTGLCAAFLPAVLVTC